VTCQNEVAIYLAELPLPPHPPYARGIISKFERIVYGVFIFFVSKSFQNQATSATAAAAAATAICHSVTAAATAICHRTRHGRRRPTEVNAIIISETCWQLLPRKKIFTFPKPAALGRTMYYLNASCLPLRKAK